MFCHDYMALYCGKRKAVDCIESRDVLRLNCASGTNNHKEQKDASAPWLLISRQLEGPGGAKELHRLWMTASALTLWRAQPLSLPLDLCENLFYDAVF